MKSPQQLAINRIIWNRVLIWLYKGDDKVENPIHNLEWNLFTNNTILHVDFEVIVDNFHSGATKLNFITTLPFFLSDHVTTN
jgi:hypothetical protein